MIGCSEVEVQYKDIVEKPNYFRDAEDFFRYQLSTKAKAWEHEQEVRLFILDPWPTYMSLLPDQNDEKGPIDWKEVRAFPEIGGIVHTHSTYATSWAQAGRAIPCYGTTHADYMYGEIPCARVLTQEEIDAGYEKNTGTVIIETFEGKDPMAVPAVLCKNHGPFAWGKDAKEAVHNAVVLEGVAKMALFTEQLKPDVEPAPQRIQDKHYYRKHGANAYYGNKVE